MTGDYAALAKSQLSSRSDNEELMENSVQGDQAAFERLYARDFGRLYTLAFRIMRSHCDAEDIVQDTFCSLWRRTLHDRIAHISPDRWLATLVRHRAIDFLRSRMREHKLASAISEEQDRWKEPPGIALAGSESANAVQSAIGLLSDGERQAVRSAFFDGLTHLEISASLSLPVGTVKARIRRGIARLRPALTIYCEAGIRTASYSTFTTRTVDAPARSTST